MLTTPPMDNIKSNDNIKKYLTLKNENDTKL